MNILTLIFGALLSENLFFSKLCASTNGQSPMSVKDSAKTGVMTVIVSTLAALVCAILYKLLLESLNAEYLCLIVLAALAMVFTQIARKALKNCDALWLPVFIGSMAVGIAAQIGTDIAASVLNALCSGIGYLIVLVLMTGVRDRLEGSNIPACLKGFPISMITAGLMALAFMGFVGLA